MEEQQDDQRPPLFRSWSSWYWLVIASLVLWISLFYYLTGKLS
ncbi:hypothetical protein [Niabella terrae]